MQWATVVAGAGRLGAMGHRGGRRQDGWPQRFFTWAKLAASSGPAGTSCFSRLANIRRISVGWLGTCIDGPLGLPVSRPYTGKGPKNQTCEEKK